MVTYSDLKALVDVLKQRDDEEAKSELQTVGTLLSEMIEYHKQASLAGVSAFMAKFYEELGRPLPENDAARMAAIGLVRIKELFEAVNVLLEKNGFSCRFDLGESGEHETEVLTNQVEWLVTEMTENGMNNYRNRK